MPHLAELPDLPEPDRPSPAVQDYLKHIYLLEGTAGREGVVQTKDLAGRLRVSSASASNMLKKLGAHGFVTYVPYQGAALTDGGRKIALEVIRHHRLLETYLAEVLGVPWDEVHDEAEILEHFISERLEERIATALGHPTLDPHGHPIPTRALDEPSSNERRLSDLAVGESALVAEVNDRDPELLRYLGERGLVPGVLVTTTHIAPYGGSISLELPEGQCSIGRDAATQVFVTREAP